MGLLLLDTTKKVLPDFKGTFNRGDDDGVPIDHLIDSLNIEFTTGKTFSRRGTSVRKSFAGGGVRSAFYQFHEADTAPIIFSSDVGHVYQEDTAVITDVNITSFAAAQMFNKLFVSPRDESHGIGDLYLYDHTNVQFRKAGGTTPSAAGAMVAVDGAAGNVPAGTRNIAVIYETETGFYTPPGPKVAAVFTPTTYTGPGALKINLSNIPLGPAGDRIIARHILITRADEEEYFFVPDTAGGTISDNVTTTAILDFFDTDLIESADYLFDIMERPPAGVGMLVYQGRLVIFGFDSPNGSLARISRAGEPESFNATDGFTIISKDDGYDLTAGFQLREVLFLGKEKGIYAVEDNGEEPAQWQPYTVDEAVGIVIDGVSQVSPAKPQGTHNDVCVIADVSGLYLFDGIIRHPELSWKIQEIWNNEFGSEFVSIVFDVQRKLLLVTGIDDGILVGNYQDGIGPQEIRWTKWQFTENVLFGGLLDTSLGNNPEYVFSTGATKQLVKFDITLHKDFGDVAFESWARTAFIGGESLSYLTAVHYKLIGAQNFNTTIIGYDDSGGDATKNEILAPIQLAAQPGESVKRYSQFVNEKVSVKFGCYDVGDGLILNSWFGLGSMAIYGREMFLDRPQ